MYVTKFFKKIKIFQQIQNRSMKVIENHKSNLYEKNIKVQ